MVAFAYHFGKRLAMEKPASWLKALAGGKGVLPWLGKATESAGKLRPAISRVAPAARNWWQRASQFGKVPAPSWALRGGPEWGMAGAQMFNLTPEWADPALNAYWMWRYPKMSLGGVALKQMLPEDAGAGKQPRERKLMEQYGGGAPGPRAAYLQAMAPQMGWHQPPPTPNYYAAVFGKPR